MKEEKVSSDEKITKLESEVKKYKDRSAYFLIGFIMFFFLSLLSSLFVYQSYTFDDYFDLVSIHPKSDVKPKYNTVAHTFLALESTHLNRHGGIDNLERFLTVVDESAKHNPKTREEVLKSLTEVGAIIKDQFFYRYNTLLSHGLYSGAVDCDNLVILYISAAEVLGYKLDIVHLPRHAMVQWGEGDSIIYWEATANDNHERTLEEITTEYKLTDEIIAASKYLKPLNEDEKLSVAYHNMSIYSWSHDMSKTILLNEKSLAYDPDGFLAQVMQAYIGVAESQSDESVDVFLKLIKKDPNYSSSYSSLGDLYLSLDKYDLAIEFFKKALSYNSHYETFRSLKHAYRKNGQYAKSFIAYINELNARDVREPLNDYTKGTTHYLQLEHWM